MGTLRIVLFSVVMLFVAVVPSSATSINPLPPGWRQIDFTYTVTEPGFFGDWTDPRGRFHPGTTNVGDVFSGYIRWDLKWWNPARHPNGPPEGNCGWIDDVRGEYCFEIAFDTPDWAFGDEWLTHSSDQNTVVLIDAWWSRDAVHVYGEADESAWDGMTLYGDLRSRRVTGGQVYISPNDDGWTPRFVGTINPSRVPEPSTLLTLIAGCFTLAIGYRRFQ